MWPSTFSSSPYSLLSVPIGMLHPHHIQPHFQHLFTTHIIKSLFIGVAWYLRCDCGTIQIVLAWLSLWIIRPQHAVLASFCSAEIFVLCYRNPSLHLFNFSFASESTAKKTCIKGERSCLLKKIIFFKINLLAAGSSFVQRRDFIPWKKKNKKNNENNSTWPKDNRWGVWSQLLKCSQLSSTVVRKTKGKGWQFKLLSYCTPVGVSLSKTLNPSLLAMYSMPMMKQDPTALQYSSSVRLYLDTELWATC